MDYSLLLGVHNLDVSSREAVRKKILSESRFLFVPFLFPDSLPRDDSLQSGVNKNNQTVSQEEQRQEDLDASVNSTTGAARAAGWSVKPNPLNECKNQFPRPRTLTLIFS